MLERIVSEKFFIESLVLPYSEKKSIQIKGQSSFFYLVPTPGAKPQVRVFKRVSQAENPRGFSSCERAMDAVAGEARHCPGWYLHRKTSNPPFICDKNHYNKSTSYFLNKRIWKMQWQWRQ